MQEQINIKIKRLTKDSIIPSYAKPGDAGMDLTATSREIDKYGNVMYGTGLAMEIPFGYAGFIYPRSSLSKYTLDLANAIGVIDAGYRGEIICKFKPTLQFSNETAIAVNAAPDFEVNDVIVNYNRDIMVNEMYDVGDKIVQIIIKPLPHILFKEVDELGTSERGDGGFGSTGN